MLQQLKDFKDFIKLKTHDDDVLKSFVDLYFTARVKHPIKNCIQIAFKDICFEKMSKIVGDVIREKIKMTCKNSNLVDCINETTQNFKMVLKIIGSDPENIVEFLSTTLKKQYDELETEISPSEKIKISIKIHATIQAIMSCVKSHLHEKGKGGFEVNQQLKEICQSSMIILSHEDIPMDTKTNCGMLIVLRNDLINDDVHFKLVRDKNENIFKRLSLISGITLIYDVNIKVITEMCEILEEIFLTNSVDSQIAIAVFRLFVQISKKFLDSKIHSVEIEAIIIKVSFSNIEHNIDTVKHLSKNSLRNLMESADLGVYKVNYFHFKTNERLSKIKFVPKKFGF